MVISGIQNTVKRNETGQKMKSTLNLRQARQERGKNWEANRNKQKYDRIGPKSKPGTRKRGKFSGTYMHIG
jgi:hypothetical protein